MKHCFFQHLPAYWCHESLFTHRNISFISEPLRYFSYFNGLTKTVLRTKYFKTRNLIGKKSFIGFFQMEVFLHLGFQSEHLALPHDAVLSSSCSCFPTISVLFPNPFFPLPYWYKMQSNRDDLLFGRRKSAHFSGQIELRPLPGGISRAKGHSSLTAMFSLHQLLVGAVFYPCSL